MISPINPRKDIRMKSNSSSVIFLLSGFVITVSFLIPTKLLNQSGDSGAVKLENTMLQLTPKQLEKK